MNPRNLAMISVASSMVLGLVLAFDTGSGGLAALALVATLTLAGGLGGGWPVPVLVGSTLAMITVAAAAGSGASSGVLVASGPLLWVAVEASWRSHELRPAVAARGAATAVGSAAARAWIGQLVAPALAALAAGLLVVAFARNVPSGGLTFRVLGLLVVVLVAGAVVLVDLRPGRWSPPRSQARGPGSPGRADRAVTDRPR